ncbi:MAG TPA: hypothetical protein VGS22_15090 [Thermoanaerobaculia bacterium]|jgi:hypothetical protein|nr:hypothetical protein [Thermoanaerobaculia bacterium]
MLRKSSPRVLAVVVCCAVCLSAGTLPAAALPGLDSSPALHFDMGSWLLGLWQAAGQSVASLFAADTTQVSSPPPPPPPAANAERGVTIDPDGLVAP